VFPLLGLLLSLSSPLCPLLSYQQLLEMSRIGVLGKGSGPGVSGVAQLRMELPFPGLKLLCLLVWGVKRGQGSHIRFLHSGQIPEQGKQPTMLCQWPTEAEDPRQWPRGPRLHWTEWKPGGWSISGHPIHDFCPMSLNLAPWKVSQPWGRS
jgi:hypothetical protein